MNKKDQNLSQDRTYILVERGNNKQIDKLYSVLRNEYYGKEKRKHRLG